MEPKFPFPYNQAGEIDGKLAFVRPTFASPGNFPSCQGALLKFHLHAQWKCTHRYHALDMIGTSRSEDGDMEMLTIQGKGFSMDFLVRFH